ncbi:MAG: hypothetical protein WCJ84_04015, partial [Candidatus Peregrinibacteria bacterium]
MKTCRQCSAGFEVTREDLVFYDKISPIFHGVKYSIPDPLLCPDCRAQRRTLHRNEQYMYHNVSLFSQKKLVSIYNPLSPRKIISYAEWFSDTWDAKSFGRDVDFSRSFFDQFHDILRDVPMASIISLSCENSEFTTGTGYCKNCYLINCSEYCENCMYSKLLQNCRDVLDSSYCYDSELLYECLSVRKGYNCAFVSYSHNCSDCYFCEDCIGCHHCFLSTGLRNKSYYFQDNPLPKEEYFMRVKEFFAHPMAVAKGKKDLAVLQKNRVHKYANSVNSEKSSGDFILNCQNCVNCFDTNDSEDCSNVQVGVKCKDVHDCSNMYINPELCYETLGTIEVNRTHFCLNVYHSQDLFYCQHCHSSHDCFGCVGLRNAQYCILNRQYSKEEYEELV